MKTRSCYVIMPFSPEFDDTYESAIKAAVDDAATQTGTGITCLRGDEIPGPGSINREIVQSIYTADVVVADLSGNNPNVFYELGVAHSIGNRTIMIAQNIKAIPFDVSAYRLAVYEPSSEGLEALRALLTSAIVDVLTGRSEASNPVQDFAPVRYTQVVMPLHMVLVIEELVTEEVWVIQPTFEVDLKVFCDVVRHNLEERNIKYRYIVPETQSAIRSWKRFRKKLDLSEEAVDRISVRVVEPHQVESEVVIYDPFTEREKVLLMSPLEDIHRFGFKARGSQAISIRERYETLWEDASEATLSDP